MYTILRSRTPQQRLHTTRCYRPWLELLEERLPPGSLLSGTPSMAMPMPSDLAFMAIDDDVKCERSVSTKRERAIKRISDETFAPAVIQEMSDTTIVTRSSSNEQGFNASPPPVSNFQSPAAIPAFPSVRSQPPVRSQNFELMGANSLFSRGMNAAPAIFDRYLYVGNRTDGSAGHPHPGVLVVDIANPSQPQVVGEIGSPLEGNVGETSRELRVWPDQQLLMVMNFACSTTIHACKSASVTATIKFYDLTGENAAQPQLISMYTPSRVPHEMFLWVDPTRPERALLYLSSPTSSLTLPNLIVTDISRAREGIFTELVKENWNDEFRPQFRVQNDVRLHSMGVSVDGARTYLAYLGGGFLIVDSSDLANDLPNPQLRLVTTVGSHPHWGDPGAHSAVKVFGRPLALVTDEVYGTLLGADHGCPWGWVRLIEMTNEVRPEVVGEYKIEQNTEAYCESGRGQDPNNTKWTSYSAHNPTVLKELALVTWHSGGMQAFSIQDPTHPFQTGVFVPQPLPRVATEDPALSLGYSKVVMWSYPIIKDGLIYVVDVRNGLYVLRYTGVGSNDVANISFLEGNSNLGDAANLEVP